MFRVPKRCVYCNQLPVYEAVEANWYNDNSVTLKNGSSAHLGCYAQHFPKKYSSSTKEELVDSKDHKDAVKRKAEILTTNLSSMDLLSYHVLGTGLLTLETLKFLNPIHHDLTLRVLELMNRDSPLQKIICLIVYVEKLIQYQLVGNLDDLTGRLECTIPQLESLVTDPISQTVIPKDYNQFIVPLSGVTSTYQEKLKSLIQILSPDGLPQILQSIRQSDEPPKEEAAEPPTYSKPPKVDSTPNQPKSTSSSTGIQQRVQSKQPLTITSVQNPNFKWKPTRYGDNHQ